MAVEIEHKRFLDWDKDPLERSWWMTILIPDRPGGPSGVRKSLGFRGYVCQEDSGAYHATLNPMGAVATDLGLFKTLDKAKEAVELEYLQEQLRTEV
jgi:hypothetical protein